MAVDLHSIPADVTTTMKIHAHKENVTVGAVERDAPHAPSSVWAESLRQNLQEKQAFLSSLERGEYGQRQDLIEMRDEITLAINELNSIIKELS